MEQERLRFVKKVLDGSSLRAFKDICEEYNISSKTGYKWLNRFLEKGEEGLKDQSRARLTQEKICDDVEEYVIALKHANAKWGPKKLKALMNSDNNLNFDIPSESSIGNILTRNNLTRPKRLRKHVARTAPLADCNNSNDVWMYDFKGWFLVQNEKKCEPLTITDGYSRYLLRCLHMKRKRTNDVWEILQGAFLEYGLPKRIRSDNGPPFATTGVGRLSPLAIKIIKAGVVPEWIEPGKPQQNGRHERFHETLKLETATPPALTLEAQVVLFQQFRDKYNNQRPHEALKQQTPSSVYQHSDRKWDGRLSSPEYTEHYQVRKIMKCGSISWGGKSFFLSESLYREYVGMKEIDEGFEIYYGPILLGIMDLRKGFNRI